MATTKQTQQVVFIVFLYVYATKILLKKEKAVNMGEYEEVRHGKDWREEGIMVQLF